MNDQVRTPAAPQGFVPYTGDAELDRRLIEVEDALKEPAFERAVELAEALLRDVPGNAEARRLLAAALRGAGRPDEALQIVRELAAQEPDNALIQNSLGTALRLAGEFDEAFVAFSRATELAPNLAPAWYNLSLIQLLRSNVDRAFEAIEQVLKIEPRFEPAVIMRTSMMREQGRFELVLAEYRRAIARDFKSAWAWFLLANLKNLKLTEADLAGIERALTAYPEPSRQRSLLLFAQSQALHDLKRYPEAFAVLAEANSSVRARMKWDAKKASADADEILAAFTPPPVATPARQGSEVIFVVSLPRSGSTLTEQILASHPKVTGGGELQDMEKVIDEESERRGGPLQSWARDATPEDWDRLGKEYLQRTARWREHKPIFVDKMLANWRYAGAIMAMLPDARIVVSRRDPLENTFSCYRQMFGDYGHGYSYDMQDVATYWHDFDRMSRRWAELYPDRVYDMVYEDLLADQEGKTRELLAFCGIEFDPACLRFYETERNVKTISSAQVREPLRRDTAKAPKYGALLDPLRAALGVPLYSPPS